MPITRRAFLKSGSALIAASALAACSGDSVRDWLGKAPVAIPNSRLLIWSSTNTIDAPLARWRRMQNDIPLVRQTFAEADLIAALRDVWQGRGIIPDLVIAPSSVVQYCHVPGMWRTFAPTFVDGAAGVSAGLQQFTDPNNELFGIPLNVQPVGVWYNSDITQLAQFPRDPDLLGAIWQAGWDAFITVIGQMHRNAPMIQVVSSIYDDIYRASSMRAVHQTTTDPSQHDVLQGIHATCMALAQATKMAQTRHFDGSWFDLVQREQIAFIVAGPAMQPALERTLITPESAWRVATPPGGWMCADSLGMAIPATANNTDIAMQCAHDFYHDLALQLQMSSHTNAIPVLRDAHSADAYTAPSIFCGGQPVGTLWCEGATQMTARALSASQSGMLRYINDQFAQFWAGSISENLLWQRIDGMATEHIAFGDGDV